MPAVPEGATLPDVEQQVGGLPSIHAQSPETMFGALGEGLQSVGEGVQKFSDVFAQHAMQVAALNNKAMSDVAYTNYLNDAGKLEADFDMNNRSMDPASATQKYTDYVGQLEQLRQKYRGTLNNPMAQSTFDQDSRRMQGYMIMNASRTVAAGTHTYREAAFNGQMETLSAAAAAATDPAQQEAFKQQITDKAYAWGKSEGLPDDAIKADILNRTSAVDLSIIDGMSKTDPEAAMQYFNAHKGEMTSDHIGAVQAKLEQDLTVHGGYLASQAGLASFGAGGGKDTRTLAQIEKDESGGRNVVNYKEARGEKGFTASGYYQITDPTWQKFAPPEVLAKYPRAIDAPKAVQTEVATAIQKNQGNAPWAESSHGGYMPGTPGAALDNLQSHAQSIFAATDNAADAYAAKWGLDPIMVRYQAEQRVEGEMNRQEYQFRQVEDSSKQSILSAIAAGGPNGEPISDLPTLFKSNPDLQKDYQNLTGLDRRSVQAYLRQGANQMTDDRLQTWANISGMSSQQILGLNPMDPKLDLTNGQREQLTNIQRGLRNKIQSQQEHDAKISTISNNRLIKMGMVDAGIIDSNGQISNPQEYQVFMGRMLQAEDQWIAQHPSHKGPVPDQDIVNMATPLLARRGASPPLWGWVPFTGSAGETPAMIPPDRYQALHDQFVGTFGYEPNPEQIGQEYEHRRQEGLEK